MDVPKEKMESNIVKIIKPKRGIFDLNLKEVWEYRELLYFLAWKDIKVRYAQTVLGAAWAIIQPLFTMIVFTVVFGMIAKIPSDNVPYPIFAYSGLLLWTYFSGSISRASNSLLSNSNLLSKVYFPRLLLPLSACLVGLVDYAIASFFLVALMFYYNIFPTLLIILIPLLLLMSFLLAAGGGMWISALSVKYRDVQRGFSFFMQILLYATPIIYPISVISGKYNWILQLNPLTGIIVTHRAVILGNVAIDWISLGISAIFIVLIFISGLIYFKSYERKFADVI
ncbi:MAG: ABC transporter permease [Euryarchaeota archaeon]|nr:ABC transporter permease [Euryarchaeota archaeon]MBU4071856.1 ABC transporter permease [Candidatus Thermoplasmatota archaeon]